MKPRTTEQIQELIAERKRIKEKQKQLQRKHYKKASEAIKKELTKKNKAKEKQTPQKTFTSAKTTIIISIYNSSNLIERDTAEESLYCTWDDLMDAQERGEGEINIEKWKELVRKTKNEIHRLLKNKSD